MEAWIVDIELGSELYGERLPDAQAVLSMLYTVKEITGEEVADENTRVSGLLPRIEKEYFLPLNTKILKENKGLPKRIRKGLRNGIFVSTEKEEVTEEDIISVERYRVPHVALDRITFESNLFFENHIIVRGMDRKPIKTFYFITTTPLEDPHLLIGQSLGANKSFGGIITKVKVHELQTEQIPLNTEEGTLLSLVLPGKKSPSVRPVYYKKRIFIENDGLSFKEYIVYGMGSYLKKDEYIAGDKELGDKTRLFVRPLFTTKEVKFLERGEED